MGPATSAPAHTRGDARDSRLPDDEAAAAAAIEASRIEREQLERKKMEPMRGSDERDLGYDDYHAFSQVRILCSIFSSW